MKNMKRMFNVLLILFMLTTVFASPQAKANDVDEYTVEYTPSITFMFNPRQYLRGSYYGVNSYLLSGDVYDFIVKDGTIIVYKNRNPYWSFTVPDGWWPNISVHKFNETVVIVLTCYYLVAVDVVNQQVLGQVQLCQNWNSFIIGIVMYPISYTPPIYIITKQYWYPSSSLNFYELRSDLTVVHKGGFSLGGNLKPYYPLFTAISDTTFYTLLLSSNSVDMFKYNYATGQVVSASLTDVMTYGVDSGVAMINIFDLNYRIYGDGAFDVKVYFAGYTKSVGETQYNYHGKRVTFFYNVGQNQFSASMSQVFTSFSAYHYTGGMLFPSTDYAIILNSGPPYYGLSIIWWDVGTSSFKNQSSYNFAKVKSTYYTPCSVGLNWVIEHGVKKIYYAKTMQLVPTITPPPTTTTTYTTPPPQYTTTYPFTTPEAHTQFILNAIIPLTILILPAGIMFYLMGTFGAVVGFLIGLGIGYSAGFIPFGVLIIIMIGVAALFVYSLSARAGGGGG